MATTLLNLSRQIAKDGYGYAQGAPSSTGTTTTIVDVSADSPLDTGDDSLLFKDSWAKIEADSAATPLDVGEVSRITTYAPSTGTLTVGRAFTNATTTTMTYGLYFGLPPTRKGIEKPIDEYINQALRRLFYHRPFLLTLVTDGDMETSGVGSWTASSATRTKSTSTGVVLGKQALRVANSGANGYAQSASVSVNDNQTYNLCADVTIASGTAVLELYDVTNSASIDTAQSDQLQTRRLWLQAKVPADCKQVAVRLKGTEASADVYWDNVSLLNTTSLEMPLPSWFDNADWLEKLEVWQVGATWIDNAHAAIDSMRRWEVSWARVVEDREGVTPFKIVFSSYPLAGAHLIGTALSPFAELTADTDSTEADKDWVCAWALAFMGMERKDKELIDRWLPEAQRLDRIFQASWQGKRFLHRSPYRG